MSIGSEVGVVKHRGLDYREESSVERSFKDYSERPIGDLEELCSLRRTKQMCW